MSTLTVHDLLGTIEGLRRYSAALRDAAESKVHVIGDYGTGVLADPVALAKISVWLDEAGQELSSLVPDGPLTAFPDRRRHETLVRLVDLKPSGVATVVLPGWNPDVEVDVKIPLHVRESLVGEAPTESAPVCVRAWVNINTPLAENLEFSDWSTIG